MRTTPLANRPFPLRLRVALIVYTPFSKREYERRAGFYIDPENLSRFVFNYDMSEIAPLLEKYRV